MSTVLRKAYKSRIQISFVKIQGQKKFGFGILLEDSLRQAFIPRGVVDAFELTIDDVNYEFDCLYIIDDKDQPIVACLSEDDFNLVVPREFMYNQSTGRETTRAGGADNGT